MSKNKWLLFASIGIIAFGICLIAIDRFSPRQQFTAIATARPTSTLGPIVPTRTRILATPTIVSSTITSTVGMSLVSPTPTLARSNPTSTFRAPSVSPTPTASRTAEPTATILYQGYARWGIAAAYGPIARYNIDPLLLGWYQNWHTYTNPFKRADLDFAQMVRFEHGTLTPNANEVTRAARANPGSLWLMSNEPDVKWQDNVEPAVYARLYRQAYQAIKSGDPTAQVAAGGIAQPSPLRLRYLEQILESYRQQFNTDLPVDAWNIHNFILREERASWGVDIPPGISDDRGILYEIDDSGNIDAFQKQIVGFRQWMADHGYRNYPLIVSEYGIPMPEDYGFPDERVIAFLYSSFDYFLATKDPLLGYPADDNRLVQRWCWFSLDDWDYTTGRLFDYSNKQLTATGLAWSAKVLSMSNAGEKK